MKIQIIGSMKFTKEMVELQQDLQQLGHEANVPIGADEHLRNTVLINNLAEDLKFCIKNDIMRRNFHEVASADAVLVVNHRRNNIDGFIGISALMEMGIAYFLNKKIFLLNDFPSFEEHRGAQEVAIMQPTLLKGDLKKIK